MKDDAVQVASVQVAAAPLPGANAEYNPFGEMILLRAEEMNPGSIKTNIEAVLAAVKEKSREYQDISKYNGDEKRAKEDRALLRKQKDLTKTTLASIQEMWNRPLEAALSGGREILKEFDRAIDTIDEWVKAGEAQEKGTKRSEIQTYFDGKDFELAPLEKIFDSRWLNKTYKMADVKAEIDGRIAEVYADIKTLENISGCGMMAKAFYLETLDMGAALNRVETLKADAVRLAREQAAREERERAERVEWNAACEREAARLAASEARTEKLVAEALGEALAMHEASSPVEAPARKTLEFTLRVHATEAQFLELRQYMTVECIVYEKIA